MRLPIIIKLFSLTFCAIGAIFLNLSSLTWFHDVLSIGLCGYVLILTVCLIVLVLHENLDSTLDYIFMLVGAILNITGGIIAIIYYCDGYERYTYQIPTKYLLGVGVFAILAGACMIADLLSIFKVVGTS